MKRLITIYLLLLTQASVLHAQTDTASFYQRKSYMVPMRDGVKLFTVVLSPVNFPKPVPILLTRTPYGADIDIKEDSSLATDLFPSYYKNMLKEGYILVFQDMRGKFKSEGTFEMTRPLYHLQDPKKTDESTDASDAVGWLVKNIPGNNGKTGIFGISYLGYTALDATSDPNPALKASSPQASPCDMFLGDDFHHNGAFRLSYGFEYSYMVENAKEANSDFPFPQFDLYDWYLKLGSPKNVNALYYKNRLPTWNDFVANPNYDSYWQKSSMLKQLDHPEIPTLHVGGYYDQEDLNGPQIMYEHLEKKDSFNRNFIVLGPWFHGEWARAKGDSIGKIDFENNTAVYFQALQKKWFDYWLKGMGDGKFPEATCFQTGSDQWKTYDTWPPKNAVQKRLYIHADGSCSFEKPTMTKGSVSYVSDPAKPVPYRERPIEATYGKDSHWRTWQVADQRFAASRPDVITFTADSLTDNLTVTGDIKAHLFVSTTGTDADFVVKLIDVYPNFDAKNLSMSGYEFPVTMEVFRGRFRKNFEKPEPFISNKPDQIVIDLHMVNHTFLKGHKLMIQIQSTWFPLIDRNPQKYIPNIFEASDADYIKATHTIYCNNILATYIELPVME
ncbi:MAG: CocE/NonD family hydrolase [Bacteroidota bacterium]|nr:CocE/NonD family hydrolase [Bacteroidota bacterium]